ncbi:MAG: AIR carboxylase family protein [Candidatus Shapirobacteria bacterium]
MNNEYVFKEGQQVAIAVGSGSDVSLVKKSEMLKIFDRLGIIYTVTIISAHRHEETLPFFCQQAMDCGVKMFIAIAGKAAALPGNIAGLKRAMPVIGVGIGPESLSSITNMPAGVPVFSTGIDRSALVNATIGVCQILGTSDQGLRDRLQNYLLENNPKVEHDINVETYGEQV